MSGEAAMYQERARLLARVGRSAEAITLLRKVTEEWTPGKAWGRNEQGMLVTSLADLLVAQGRLEEADRLLVAAPQRLGPGSHLLNIMATHAFILADGGRYREALAIVEATAQQYEATSKTIGGMLNTIPGSERYFAGIRGCALAGLGRKAEAEAALVPVLGTKEPGSLLYRVPESNGEVRLRIYACLRDRAAYAREIVASITADPAGPTTLALMQPAVKTALVDPALLAATRSDPQVVAALSPTARLLPPELVPALNNWAN
jgi:tetratricopeptide (TPR) repeat protein